MDENIFFSISLCLCNIVCHEVEQGKCYRLRWIMMGSNTENFVVDIKGHNMTLISTDGVDVKPIQVSAVNLHLGERADTLICANQEPGNYLITFRYDYACSLLPGNFIPRNHLSPKYWKECFELDFRPCHNVNFMDI